MRVVLFYLLFISLADSNSQQVHVLNFHTDYFGGRRVFLWGLFYVQEFFSRFWTDMLAEAIKIKEQRHHWWKLVRLLEVFVRIGWTFPSARLTRVLPSNTSQTLPSPDRCSSGREAGRGVGQGGGRNMAGKGFVYFQHLSLHTSRVYGLRKLVCSTRVGVTREVLK